MPHRKASYIIGSRTPGGDSEELIAEDLVRLQRGLEWAQSIASKFGWNHVWLVTHTRDDLSERVNPELVKALGTPSAKRLQRGAPVPTGSLIMKNETFAGLLRGTIGESILAIYPRPELLDRIDAQRMDNVVTVVPSIDNLGAWIEKWKPRDPDATE
jgi:hypothetical protein